MEVGGTEENAEIFRTLKYFNFTALLLKDVATRLVGLRGDSSIHLV